MSEAIALVAGMDELKWRQMSDAAYATATEYTWDNATDQFEAAIRQLWQVKQSSALLTA
jgi:hypothetical protein